MYVRSLSSGRAAWANRRRWRLRSSRGASASAQILALAPPLGQSEKAVLERHCACRRCDLGRAHVPSNAQTTARRSRSQTRWTSACRLLGHRRSGVQASVFRQRESLNLSRSAYCPCVIPVSPLRSESLRAYSLDVGGYTPRLPSDPQQSRLALCCVLG